MKKTLALILSALMLVSVMAVNVFGAAAVYPSERKWDMYDGNFRVDLDTTKTLALRFSTQGTGNLTAIIPYWGGTDGSVIDLNVYEWAYNYEYTVNQNPVATVNDVTVDATTDKNWLGKNKIELPNGGLPAGEYLAVVTVDTTSWAVCNYLTSQNTAKSEETLLDGPAFKVYINGEVATYDTDNYGSGYHSLLWELDFASGGWAKYSVVLSEDVEAPTPTTEAPTTATTTAAPDTAESSDNAGDSTETSDNALVVSLTAAAVMGLAVLCVVKKKQH